MSEKKEKDGKTVSKTAAAIFSIAIGVCSAGAAAQGANTWRCGNTYSDQPCEGGRTVKVDDRRSDENRRAADAGTRGVQTQADRMERNRLSLEKAAYERDQRAAREARSAALAEKRLAMAEQKERDRARKEASAPRKSSMSFSSSPGTEAPDRKKKKRKSAG